MVLAFPFHKMTELQQLLKLEIPQIITIAQDQQSFLIKQIQFWNQNKRSLQQCQVSKLLNWLSSLDLFLQHALLFPWLSIAFAERREVMLLLSMSNKSLVSKT
jgi:hypothetical protein